MILPFEPRWVFSAQERISVLWLHLLTSYSTKKIFPPILKGYVKISASCLTSRQVLQINSYIYIYGLCELCMHHVLWKYVWLYTWLAGMWRLYDMVVPAICFLQGRWQPPWLRKLQLPTKRARMLFRRVPKKHLEVSMNGWRIPKKTSSLLVPPFSAIHAYSFVHTNST